MNDASPKKKVTISADLYDAYAALAAKDGRVVERIIEASLASSLVQRRGGSAEERAKEYNVRMGFTEEEDAVFADALVKKVRAQIGTERETKEDTEKTKKGEFDA